MVSLPDPSPAPHGVVVKVEATGVCRSDWHGWMEHDADITLPHVPGHELAGTVAAAGRDVSKWNPGDRVTVPFAGGCGACLECHAGHQQVCHSQFQPGFTHWGSFAEYVSIHHADLNLVAVHGCGGVGLSVVMIATALGANVIAVDISEEKLALARSLGAVAGVDASTVADAAEAVREISRGGAHVSLDALGASGHLLQFGQLPAQARQACASGADTGGSQHAADSDGAGDRG